MRKHLVGIVAAIVLIGCGQVDPAAEPSASARPAPVVSPTGHQIIGEYQAKVTPNPDGRTALFEVNIQKDGEPGTNPAQSIELYSSDFLRIGSGHGASCSGDDLYAPVVIKSYYSPDQLRDVVAEMTSNSGTGNGLCSRGSAPSNYGGGSELYNYANLDPWNGTTGTASSATVTWAFNYANLTPFYINFRVWARKWPDAGTIQTPSNGSIVSVPSVTMAHPDSTVTTFVSKLFTDSGLTGLVPSSTYTTPRARTGVSNLTFNLNGSAGTSPAALVDGSTYYVGVYSRGRNSTNSTWIVGSQYATDHFVYAKGIAILFPASVEVDKEFMDLVADDRLQWISSSLSSNTKYSIFECDSMPTCGQNGPVVEGYENVSVSGNGSMLSNSLNPLDFYDGNVYRWEATQFFNGTQSMGSSTARLFTVIGGLK
jgi:hypothetical protein